jgi:hypothetical protein
MLLKSKLLILNGLLLSAIIAHSAYRDIQLEKQYPGDLRNRVVGARLEKDGRLPYFYFWTPRDGSRYLDPQNRNNSHAFVSNITASPFFHELLYPICDLPQRTLSGIWMWLQYLLLAGMIWMTCGLTTDPTKKILIINAGILFTVTEAWKSLISAGQLYLFVGFLMSCIIAGLLHNKRKGILFASICAAALVLIRPIALVIFLPFIFQYKKNLLFLSAAFGGLALYGLFVFFVPFENALWKEYSRAIEMHVSYHQLQIPAAEVPPGPKVSQEEGFDFAQVEKNIAEHPIKVYSESGNVFVFYEQITHKKMPLAVMNILCALSVFSLTGIFFYIFRKNKPPLLQVLILGFTLYMLVELFSPIHRRQYNTVEWFPIVLAGFLLIHEWKKPAFLLLTLGILLNILNTPWILMRHSLGEICWLAGLLLIAFTPTENKILWKKQQS